MLLFILIFFALVIAVGVSAVVGFSIYLKRRGAKSLESNNQFQFQDAPPYRSLFEPDEGEIRALEREEAAKASFENKQAAQNILLEKEKAAREFQRLWLENPTKQNTIEMLFLAAQSESAKTFSETAQSVIQVWRKNKIKNLTADDLADLLDSHLGMLAQQERASGASFWLKQEIERLRRKSKEL